MCIWLCIIRYNDVQLAKEPVQKPMPLASVMHKMRSGMEGPIGSVLWGAGSCH